jgi:uncharacterized Zn-finger protein
MEAMVATVKCPYCKRYLIVEIEGDYRTAEGRPESTLPEEPGRSQVCPRCQKRYFVRYIE